MDDPGSLDYYNQVQNNPALQGWKGRDLTPEEQKRWDQYSAIAGMEGPDKYHSYVTADPALREEFMGKPNERMHFGETVQGPNGPMQSIYQEPKKPSFSAKYMPLVFGGALAAITGGAAAPLLGGLMSAGINYGSTGKFNAGSLGGSVLGAINPALGQAYGLGNAAYQASKGNYSPGLGMAGNYAWNSAFG